MVSRTLVSQRQKPAPGALVLDHVGHFVRDLDAAARLLEALGFSPTPVSHHVANGKPAGTSNRCVMLEEGYLEILAPTMDTPNAERIRRSMQRYSGVHLVCYGTPAAQEEHARLASHGFSPEPLVELRRRIDDGREVGFRVVYAPAEAMPECRAQYCEHLTPEVLWEEKNLGHRNGVTALAAAYLVAEDPALTAARWAEFSGLLPSPHDDGVVLETSRGTIHIASREALSRLIPNVPAAPAVAAIELKVREPGDFAALCAKAGLEVTKPGGRRCVSLPEALGGAWVF
ncbi:MAG: VOC family protein [Betaproteobacteria bacterium]|nr:VOC family protein [Betaproteobacteria bacterium]